MKPRDNLRIPIERWRDDSAGTYLGLDTAPCRGLFLVAPDDREGDVREQLSRPAFSRVTDLKVRYLPYGELVKHRETMARFGAGMRPIEAIARMLA